MFFESWTDLARVLIIGTLAYFSLVTILRVSGKRTLAKMAAFDLVVTVAFGSTLATVLLTKDVTLAEGILAFGVLAALQFIIAWSLRFKGFRRVIKSEPRILLVNGKLDEKALKDERLTLADVTAAVRGVGIGSLENVAVVVLEVDGSLSVIENGKLGNASALKDLDGVAS